MVMPQGDYDAGFGQMRNNYRQNSFGFGQLLLFAPGVRRRLLASGQQVAARYRRKAPKGTEAHSRSANDVKVAIVRPGGRKGDRQSVMVTAKPRNAAGMKALGETTAYLSGGRKINSKGKVS